MNEFYIDDCLLVSNARLISKKLYGGDGNETLISTINKLALHIYKYFAMKYKETHNETGEITYTYRNEL